MAEQISLDQLIAKISKHKLNIHYTVLDDLRKNIHPDILKSNPLVEKILDDMENDPATIGDVTDDHNLGIFKIQKKCFHSLNFTKMVDPLHKEQKYVKA